MRAALVLALLAAIAAGTFALTRGGAEPATRAAAAPPAAQAPRSAAQPEPVPETPRRRGNPVVVLGPDDRPEDADEQLPADAGAAPARGDPRDDAPSPSAPTNADVRRELALLRRHAGGRARLTPDGLAIAPFDAPLAVQRIIAAGNHISRAPYKWGGGHGRWVDDGYDCSGSVSFALAAAGLLDAPLVSGALARWGARGAGRWVTIYANDGHVFMVVAGLRFDTSGRSSRNGGSRWQPELRSPAGYAVRHPPGL